MLERLRNWLSDDAIEETNDKGWGLPLWWGATIVALFTAAITWCGPATVENVAAAPGSPTTTAPLAPGGPNMLDVISRQPELSFFRGLIAFAAVEEGVAIGPDITFFAPTDEAFAALSPDLLDAIRSDPEIALNVLGIHLTPGKQPLADFVSAGAMLTVGGLSLPVIEEDGTAFIDTAAVIDRDLEASNGFLNIIDEVLGLTDHSAAPAEPESPAQPLSQLLIERDDLGTLVAALGPASATLFGGDDGSGFTVFAPTDAAFESLPAGSVDLLLATNPKLLELLGYHVVPGTFLSTDLNAGMVLTTQSGAELPVSVVDGALVVGEAAITESDITGSNGVIHIVDSVLLPPEFELPTLNEALGLESITFETASAVITPEGLAALEATVDFLTQNPTARVAIEGHTDSQGDEDGNLRLSKSRADSVRDYLVGQGIAFDRLETEGFGETRPVASNDTPEGRAQNRRIDFRLL